MKAILVGTPGGPENLEIKMIDKPSPSAGQVLIEVKAFGVNRAELYRSEERRVGKECVP